MHKFDFIVATLAGMMLLSGCSSMVNPTSFTASSAESLPTPTEIVPTEDPTEVETEVVDEFTNFHECHTWREAKENCVVSLDDLMSGKLVDYARIVTKPFPENAFSLTVDRYPKGGATNSFYFSADAIGPVDEETRAMLEKVDPAGRRYNNDVFSDPRSPIGDKLVFWIKGDGTSNLKYDIFAEVVKVKNKDGSDGYYTVLGLPVMSPDGSMKVDQVETERRYDTIFDIFYYQPPLYDGRYLSDTEDWVSDYENMKMLLDILRDSGDVNKKLMDEWVMTDIIPKELETRLLISVFIDNYFGYGVPWAK
jgi:hypothetical protein